MLIGLFILKIAVSLVFLVIPFLFFSTQKLATITGVQSKSANLFRLYGWAIVALLVGYGFGLSEALAGSYPLPMVVMGIVSNGGATVILLMTGAWHRNQWLCFTLGMIAIGLALTLLTRL